MFKFIIVAIIFFIIGIIWGTGIMAMIITSQRKLRKENYEETDVDLD